MTILRGKTQQFAEILKSSYLGNGNKSKQNVWEFHRYEEYLNLGKFPYYGQCNTYIAITLARKELLCPLNWGAQVSLKISSNE